MKKLILLFCFILVSSQAFSQLLIENFDYSSGSPLTSNSWTQIAAVATNPITVTAPGLTYTNYIGSGIGNAATLVNTGQDVYKDFTSTQTSGTMYASMMVNVTTGRNGGDYFATMCEAASTTNFFGRFFVKLAANGNLAFGVSKAAVNSPVTPSYSDSIYTTGVTYLIVVKYAIIAGPTNDEASLFVFSGAVPPTEPAPTVGPVTTSQADAANLGRFVLRQGTAATAPNIIVDGIYVETSWNNNVLPVELSSFTSTINKRDVTLNWTTSSERNNSGFEIERSSVNGSWTKVGNVAGNGTTNSATSYSYSDRGLATGNYSYRLKQIDFNGNFEYFNLSNEVNIGIPSKYELSQNYPNPFNPTTNINYDLPFDGSVSIKLFDMSGKEVATLVNEVKTAGYYSVNFNAATLSSGVYFYSISANNFIATKKMMLLK